MRAARRRVSVELHVQLLGRIEVTAGDGTPVRLSGRHAQALFALLVLCRRPRSRDALAADLWPDADAASSAALRQALWLVRNAFNSGGFDADENEGTRAISDYLRVYKPRWKRPTP